MMVTAIGTRTIRAARNDLPVKERAFSTTDVDGALIGEGSTVLEAVLPASIVGRATSFQTDSINYRAVSTAVDVVLVALVGCAVGRCCCDTTRVVCQENSEPDADHSNREDEDQLTNSKNISYLHLLISSTEMTRVTVPLEFI
jgi:hypothetical protein